MGRHIPRVCKRWRVYNWARNFQLCIRKVVDGTQLQLKLLLATAKGGFAAYLEEWQYIELCTVQVVKHVKISKLTGRIQVSNESSLTYKYRKLS